MSNINWKIEGESRIDKSLMKVMFNSDGAIMA